jgi:hypothetical protein
MTSTLDRLIKQQTSETEDIHLLLDQMQESVNNQENCTFRIEQIKRDQLETD